VANQPDRIERYVIPRDVVASTGQLVRERFHRENGIALCSLSLEEALGRGKVLDRKMRSLEERQPSSHINPLRLKLAQAIGEEIPT
jgi:hypothetical protein